MGDWPSSPVVPLEQRHAAAAPGLWSEMAVRMLPSAHSRTPRTLRAVMGSPIHTAERRRVKAADDEEMTVVDVMEVIPIE